MNEAKELQAGDEVTYFRPFGVEDIRVLVAGALTGRADQWDEDAFVESQRGAANRAKVDTLRWGAVQLRELAGLVKNIPDGENTVYVVTEEDVSRLQDLFTITPEGEAAVVEEDAPYGQPGVPIEPFLEKYYETHNEDGELT